MLYKQKLFGDYVPETQFLKTFGEMVSISNFTNFQELYVAKTVCTGGMDNSQVNHRYAPSNLEELFEQRK